jgi:hypothetical protein
VEETGASTRGTAEVGDPASKDRQSEITASHRRAHIPMGLRVFPGTAPKRAYLIGPSLIALWAVRERLGDPRPVSRVSAWEIAKMQTRARRAKLSPRATRGIVERAKMGDRYRAVAGSERLFETRFRFKYLHVAAHNDKRRTDTTPLSSRISLSEKLTLRLL